MTVNEPNSGRNETSGDCIVIDKAALLDLGGSYETAAVYSVIQAMTANIGFAVAGLDQIAYEARVSYTTAHRATKHLRALGWIEAHRSHHMDPTLTWMVR